MLVPTPMNLSTCERLRAARHNTPSRLAAFGALRQARHTQVAVFDASQLGDTCSLQVPFTNVLGALGC